METVNSSDRGVGACKRLNVLRSCRITIHCIMTEIGPSAVQDKKTISPFRQ